MKVVWTRRARIDLKAQCDVIARDSVGSALAVEGRVLEAVGGLCQYPERGRASVDGTRSLPVRRTSLIVFYQIDPNAIRVLHVRHMARRPTRSGAAKSIKD